jgi:hypothetical protein
MPERGANGGWFEFQTTWANNRVLSASWLRILLPAGGVPKRHHRLERRGEHRRVDPQRR